MSDSAADYAAPPSLLPNRKLRLRSLSTSDIRVSDDDESSDAASSSEIPPVQVPLNDNNASSADSIPPGIVAASLVCLEEENDAFDARPSFATLDAVVPPSLPEVKRPSIDDPKITTPLVHPTALPSSSAGDMLPPMSFSGYLRAQLTSSEYQVDSDVSGNTQTLKKERVENFLTVPWEFEKLMALGYLVCLDSFLFVYTFLPARIVIALWKVFVAIFQPIKDRSERQRILTSTQKFDLMKGMLVAVCCYLLEYVDGSQLYHSVRGQSVIKLYVIFNCLEICDKLCSAFGHDILDSLFSKAGSSGVQKLSLHRLNRITHFAIALGYIFLHTMVLFYQVMALNVAINSHNNALLSLLLSNQFVELKGSVFKRFERENLFQLACADIVERFQLSVFLLIITIRNFVELTGYSFSAATTVEPGSSPMLSIVLVSKQNFQLLQTLATPALAVFATELLVDWLKHAFITKFNLLRADTVYPRYAHTLCRDLAAGGSSHSGGVDDNAAARSLAVARRVGFVSLPLACLVVRVLMQTGRMVLSNGRGNADARDIFAAFDVLRSCVAEGVVDWNLHGCVATVHTWATSAGGWTGVAIQTASAVAKLALVYLALVAAKLLVGYNLIRVARRRAERYQQAHPVAAATATPVDSGTPRVAQPVPPLSAIGSRKQSTTDLARTGLRKGSSLPRRASVIHDSAGAATTTSTTTAGNLSPPAPKPQAVVLVDDGYGKNFPVRVPDPNDDGKLDRIDRFDMVKSRIV
ncbi:hypothetical protein HDU83_001095 [Entophlyctis luteolus]|nr:hypothetical protein HDU83_001095 [Entophlyctis luteolus]